MSVGAAPLYPPALDQAFTKLYSADFAGSQGVLDSYIRTHPSDPVAWSVKASGYLFAELDRLGILETDFFQDDRRISESKKRRADPAVRDAFYSSVHRAQGLAQEQLARNPNDANAIFATCLASGNLTDYVALIEKHQLQSLSLTKQGYRDARHLLTIEPQFYDAYLTTGFTEYVIGSMPLIFRWFLKFDDVQGDKQEGVRTLQIVADKGHYLKPFAKILLATAYLRDKHPDKTAQLLRELSDEYPANMLLKRQLQRLSETGRKGR